MTVLRTHGPEPWWDTYRLGDTRPGDYTLTCEVCGRAYPSAYPQSRVCHDTCARVHRARKGREAYLRRKEAAAQVPPAWTVIA